MLDNFAAAADAVLKEVVMGNPRVPGVVAMATDRNATSTKAPPASAGSIATPT